MSGQLAQDFLADRPVEHGPGAGGVVEQEREQEDVRLRDVVADREADNDQVEFAALGALEQ
jgi:hypothetical protein